MKKILALMLTVCMVLTLCAPVFAVEEVAEIETTANNTVLAQVYADLTNDIGIHATTDPEMLAEMATMKRNYIEFICGTEENNSSEAVASTTKLSTVVKNADNAKAALIADKAERTNALFNGIILDESTSSANYTTTAKNITFLGLAYATPGCEGYYKNEEIRDLIVTLLQEFYVFFNNANLMDTYFGNWWDWEIGVPNQLSQLFVIMEDEIAAADPELFSKYVTCLDAYLQKGKDGDVDLTSRFHTGANLADITMNRILQGIVTKDGERITNGVANMMTVFAQIDPNNIVNGNTDGVYADGSFIQHHRVAYTGSYGTTLLKKASQSVIVLSGTRFQPQDQLDTLQEWIYDCFTPITFEGYVMEIVKGRAISRTGTGYGDCNTIVDCSLQILPFLNEQEGAALREHIKYLVNSRVANKTTAANLSLGVIGSFTEIMNDDSIEAVNHSASGHYAFNAMDRNVHVREGYAFALARSSDRISKYEYMSGENKQAWFQGDGVFYLYQADRNQAQTYGHVFYAITGAYNLPGTTVPVETRKTIQEWTGGLDYYYNEDPSWGFTLASDVNQNDYVYFPVGTNDYSGSVTLNGYGAAGMELGDDNTYAAWVEGKIPQDFVTYKNAEANKAYFMFDDEIVVLSSNIHDTKGREVMSTIDSRMSEANDPASVVVGYADGVRKDLTENGQQENVLWVAYNTASAGTSVGYCFLEGNTVNFSNGLKTADLNEFRKQNTGIVERNLFTMTYEHGAVTADNTASYAYVILPNADADTTGHYAFNPNVKVLANTPAVQAVEQIKSGVKGYMFYTEAEVAGLKAYSEASVLAQKSGTKLALAVSDPIFDQTEIVLELDGEYMVAEANENIVVTVAEGKTILTVDVEDAYGASFEIVLEKAPSFTDVPGDSFYSEAVEWAVDQGITTGIGDGTFLPERPVTRAETVTFLWREAGMPGIESHNPFVDIFEDDFYYAAVLYAVTAGATTGKDATHFVPLDTCNRAEAVTFLWRLAGEPKVEIANPFTDVAEGQWYTDAVLWAVSEGITNGMTETEFGVTTACNRAHIVTFLYRAFVG